MLEWIALGKFIGEQALEWLISNCLDNGKAKLLAPDLNKAITTAVEKTAQNEKLKPLFEFKTSALTQAFWRNEALTKELWESMADKRNLERIPDFDTLWNVYCTVCTDKNSQMPRPEFDQAMETFWHHFLEQAYKPGSQLYDEYQEKLAHLRSVVYPHEGRLMIAKYCKGILPKLEQELSNRFVPPDVPEDKKPEFLIYYKTKLTYVADAYNTAPQKEEKEADLFLQHERIILIADGGVGKSRFLLELEKDLLKKNADHPENIPLYMEAKSFAGNNYQDLANLIDTEVRKIFSAKPEGKIKGFTRYLIRERRIFPLIDAFDQVTDQTRMDNLLRMVAHDTLLGKGKCCLSTRPYKYGDLLRGIADQRGDTANFKTVRLHPFDEKGLETFFADYPIVQPIIKKLAHSKQEQNVIQIPLLARMLKIMAIKGKFDKVFSPEFNHEFQHQMTKTQLIKYFVDFILTQQSTQHNENKDYYEQVELALRELSLKTLMSGQIQEFEKKTALEVFGRDYKDYFSCAKRMQFICHFMNYESLPSLEEEKHRFQHQIFQEFFAAQRLYDIYQKENRLDMQNALQEMKYMPEVGAFLAEMVEQGYKREEDFQYWQDLLMNPKIGDWARTYAWTPTYALQVRDKLGEGKAKHCLEKLFAEENQELGAKLPSPLAGEGQGEGEDFITIPTGAFIYGSYEYDTEQPVRLVADLPEFEIACCPVTNKQYKKFIDAGGYTNKEYWTENGWQWREKENVTQPEYWDDEKWNQLDYPVVGVSWYEAVAYCNWLSREYGHNYRLPTEEEWEKAARGSHGRKYPWGNKFDKGKCNTEESGIKNPTPVLQYPQGISPYGCFDMAGNVWEWTETQYDTKETRADFKAVEMLTKGPVQRGGCWNDYQEDARCSARDDSSPINPHGGIGFRCLRIPNNPGKHKGKISCGQQLKN